MRSTTLRFLIPVIGFIAVLFSVPVTAADKNVNVTNPVLNVQGNVTVTNAPNNPVPVEVIPAVGARTPYQETVLDLTWATSQVILNFSSLASDERLVIEHISAAFSMAPNEELSAYTLTLQLAGASSVAHRIDIPPEGAPGFTGSRIYNGGQAARLYTDQAPVVRANRVLISGSSTAFARAAGVTISGYKIPRISPSLAP